MEELVSEIPDLLKFLRGETSEAHRRLDEQISVSKIASSRDHYRDYLLKFRRGVSQAHSLISWAELENADLPDLEKRQARYASLNSDLHELSSGPLQKPSFTVQETTPSLASSVGALYVLEGSVHGGRQILNELQKNLPDLQNAEIRFLSAFGSETGNIWKRFCQWLGFLTMSVEEQNEACRTAVQTFTIFEEQFSNKRSS